MPGYVIHVAIAQEYIKKHQNHKEDYMDFINGSIEPDLVKPKSESHYGKSPSYTNLKNFLYSNNIDNSFNRGKFLHLITDYLFYNVYVEHFSIENFLNGHIYDDYDILNKIIIKKYNVKVPDKVKNNVFFKEGKTTVFSLELAYKIIDEISSLDIDNVAKEVLNDEQKWHTYKNIV